MNKKIGLTIQLAVSGALIFFLIFFVRLERLKMVLSKCSPPPLLMALGLLPFILWLRAYRWAWIINRKERYFPLLDLFFLTLTGVALGFVTPGSLGEIGRSYFGTKAFGYREEMVSSTVVDKLYGLLALFLLGAICALPLSFFGYGTLSLALFSLLALFLVVPDLFPWEKMSHWSGRFVKRKLDAARLLEGFTLSFKRKMMVTFLSLLSWLGTYFLFFLICLSFQSGISFSYVLAMAPLISLAGLFPLTFVGVGSHEAVIVYLFLRVGIPAEVALLVSLTFRLVFIIVPGIAGVALMSLFEKRRVAETPP
ncbi:MAG: flippase-like domain-containing protein [Candidatus Omnitrophica bacterium]|nr:flippase-like domain-containing protein [Candidatus Omnitrophota bacterium]